ncbi:hypothetical protein [Kitasatospora aburaviensis]|uniref:Uncharacterized protein n=2 Tax=Kitasatospora TaxID=2063 RepID=A0ABW1ERT0_9ACTN
MQVGELVATFDIDASGAVRGIAQGEAALAGLQRSSDGRLRDLRGRFASESQLMGQALSDGIAAGTRAVGDQAEDVGRRVADGLGQGGEDASRRLLSSMSDAELAVHGFTRSADGRIRDLRGRFVAESSTIGDALARGIGADGDQAAQRLGRGLGNVSRDLRRGSDDGRGMGRALSSIGDAAGAIGSVAGRLSMVAGAIGGIIPLAAGLAATLANIVPAAGLAATGLLAVASAGAAIKIGTSGIGGAIKAAFADAPAAAGGAAGAANKVANAQRAVADATEQAARANERAARQVEDAQRTVGDAVQASTDAQIEALRQVAQAERSLEDAQRSALQAQRDLDDARTQATQDLEDMQNRLIDGALDQRSATLRVQQAQESLNKTLADPTATQLQRDQAQLAADEAQQHLREQGVSFERLKAQAAAAAQAGVDGSDRVVSAQERLSDAQRAVADQQQALADAQVSASKRVAAADRDVSDARRALSDAQKEQAQTAADGAQQIARAMESLQQAGAGAAGGGVDPLAAALAKLSPNARAFVEEIIRLKPALADLKVDVQQALFEGLDSTLRTTAAASLPVLHTALVASASHLNAMGKEVGQTATQLAESGVLGQALASANRGLGSMSALPATIVQGLVQIGAAAGPTFERLSASAGGAIDRLADRMSAALASGGMQKAIEQAVGLIGQLGDVVGNIGSILGAVFGAAQQQGGSFVQTLQKVTAAMADAFASPAVQSGLQALFGTMSTLASTAAPLLATALQVIGPVLAALGPPAQLLVQSLGAALQPVLVALGPVLLAAAQAVGSLVSAVSPLLGLIGTLASALLPAVTPLLDGLNTIFQQAQPLVAELAAALQAALGPILAQLPALITPFVTILTNLTGALLPVLTQLITQLPLQQLGQAFAQVAIALTPVLTQLAELQGKLLAQLLPLVTPIITAIAKLAAIFGDELAATVRDVVVPALRLISSFLKGDLDGAVQAAKDLLSGLVSTVVRRFTELPAAIGGVLADLGSSMLEAGGKIIDSLVKGIKNGFNKVKDTLSGLTDLLPDWKGPADRDARLLTPAGQLIMDSLIGGFVSRLPAVRGQLQGLTDEIGGMSFSSPFGSPQLAAAGGGSGGAGFGGLNITNYYEREGGSARSTAEELAWLAKGRG